MELLVSMTHDESLGRAISQNTRMPHHLQSIDSPTREYHHLQRKGELKNGMLESVNSGIASENPSWTTSRIMYT